MGHESIKAGAGYPWLHVSLIEKVVEHSWAIEPRVVQNTVRSDLMCGRVAVEDGGLCSIDAVMCMAGSTTVCIFTHQDPRRCSNISLESIDQIAQIQSGLARGTQSIVCINEPGILLRENRTSPLSMSCRISWVVRERSYCSQPLLRQSRSTISELGRS